MFEFEYQFGFCYSTGHITCCFAAQPASGPGLSLNLVKLYLFNRSVNKSENDFVEINLSIIARINLEQLPALVTYLNSRVFRSYV